ncbi:MAG: LysR family transcriptional regulator [Desulfobacter sp.]|nr:MAG: LysR family transcriptional regulator [Desulfobacter sp.]
MDHISIAQIKILDAVDREKNFSRAAQYLGISQPAVSLQLRELQKRYGVGIYFRRGKQIHLSELGVELVKTGRKVLGLLAEMDASLKEAGDLLTGRIHIGLSCHYFVKGLIAEFMGCYPGVRVKASIGHSESLMAEVLDCRMDVAEVTALQPDPRLHHFKYSEQEILLFIASTHPWAAKGKMDIRALHGERMVALHSPSMTRQIFNRRLDEENICPKIMLELDNWDAMKEVVAAGVGFGIALEDEFGPDPRLAKIRLTGADLTAGQYFVCQPEYRELAVISAFLDIAEKEKEKNRIFKQLSKGDEK